MILFTDLSLGESLLYFVIPMFLLSFVMIACLGIYSTIFRNILPSKIHNFFLVPVALLGFYIWASPMNMGFYNYFRSFFLELYKLT